MTLSQMKKTQKTPIADLKTVQEWFEKAANNADSQGKSDSAALWRDGLAHLNSLTSQSNSLLEALKYAEKSISDVTWTEWDGDFDQEETLRIVQSAISKAQQEGL